MTFHIAYALPLSVKPGHTCFVISDANDKWVATINTDAGADAEAVKDLIEAQIRAKNQP